MLSRQHLGRRIFGGETTPWRCHDKAFSGPMKIEGSNEAMFEVGRVEHYILGGGFKHFLFSILLGEMIQFD